MKREVFIPFCGFYESWIDMLIDDHLEQEAEEFGIEEMTPEHYRVNFEGIAREYVDLYYETLRETMDDEGQGFDTPQLTFKELISPQFYNFETDRILCEVDDVSKLWAVRFNLMGTKKSLQLDIEKRFKSCDGFASFYDRFVDEWQDKPLEDWDCNELSILLPDYDFEDFDLDLTNFHEAIYNNVEVLQNEV